MLAPKGNSWVEYDQLQWAMGSSGNNYKVIYTHSQLAISLLLYL